MGAPRAGFWALQMGQGGLPSRPSRPAWVLLTVLAVFGQGVCQLLQLLAVHADHSENPTRPLSIGAGLPGPSRVLGRGWSPLPGAKRLNTQYAVMATIPPACDWLRVWDGRVLRLCVAVATRAGAREGAGSPEKAIRTRGWPFCFLGKLFLGVTESYENRLCSVRVVLGEDP